jgi:6-phosphogluconolactonase
MTFKPVVWTLLPNAAAVASAACERIHSAAAAAIGARGEFRLVLAGGETPRAVYQQLAASGADFSRWRLWFGDERCSASELSDAADAPQRNSEMVDTAWLAAVAAAVRPRSYPMLPKVGAGGTADAADAADAATCAGLAAAYASTLPDGPFDLVLLGLGEDGHTASLFPGHDWGCGADAPGVLRVSDAPKPPPLRLSLSCARLSQTRQVLFLVTGASKRHAVAAWRAGREIPAAVIRPLADAPAVMALEALEVLLDEAAAGS